MKKRLIDGTILIILILSASFCINVLMQEVSYRMKVDTKLHFLDHQQACNFKEKSQMIGDALQKFSQAGIDRSSPSAAFAEKYLENVISALNDEKNHSLFLLDLETLDSNINYQFDILRKLHYSDERTSKVIWGIVNFFFILTFVLWKLVCFLADGF